MTIELIPAPQQKTIQEEVTVVAVEVPIRVLQKGQTIKNLTKEDFEVYENGVKQAITAFEVVSRRISIPKETSPDKMNIPSKKRTFFLIFNIFDYNEAVGEAIDYFFENIFQKRDQIIILTEDRLLNIETGKGISAISQNLKETLKKYKIISTAQTFRAYESLRIEADRLLANLRGNYRNQMRSWDQDVLRFYNNYMRVWSDYKRQHIVPDIEIYRSIIKRVKQIEGEKWALCFQQRELFPKLKNEGSLERAIREKVDATTDDPVLTAQQRNIRTKQMELQRNFDVSGNIPTEGLNNLFMEANITFHLILLRSPRSLLAQDFELREVSRDYEDCFKQISFSTGGYSTFSNRVSEALQAATESEDYHYLLVYSPKDSQSTEKRDIEVKVNKRGVDIFYLKQIPEIGEPLITISNFKINRKTISFSLVNYIRTKIEGKLTGIGEIKITIFDEKSNKVFDEGKTLNLIDEEINISLNFNWLESGSYFIIIQAVDKISQEVDVFSSTITL
jgi:hypothetical protein